MRTFHLSTACWLLALSSLLSGCREAPETADATSEQTAAATATAPTLNDAFLLLQRQDAAGAAEVLEQVVANEPENLPAWRFYGTTLQTLERDEEAEAALRRALAIDAEDQPTLYALASLEAGRGNSDDAIALLEKLKASGTFDYSQVTIDPNLASLHDDPRFDAFRMRPEDFAEPFVEQARVIHEWRGEAENDEFGWIARNIGDVDGDGVDDAVVSAPSKNVEGAQAGRVYVYSGKSGAELWRHSGAPGDRLGASVDAAEDVDADGIPDVAASAPSGDRALVFSGRDGEVVLELIAAQPGENFGDGIRGVGDLDGDGHGEVIVGASQNDAEGENAGRAAVYSGKSGEILQQWFGEAPGHRFGAAVAGWSDGERTLLMVGAPDAGDGRGGRVYVYDALEDEPRFTIESDAGGAELGAMFLSVVGDLDADGVPDLYASDWAHGGGGPQTGRIVVHSGVDGEALLTLSGEAAGDGFGIGPADAGDVDGDGHDDLIVGAWQHASAAPGGGKVYLYSGKDGSLLRAWTGRVMGETFGFDATGMGDVDGDGKVDFLLTSAWSAIHGAKSGRVFVLAGD